MLTDDEFKNLKTGDVVTIIKGKGILRYNLFGDKNYIVRDIARHERKIMLKSFWVDIDRVKLKEKDSGLVNFSTPTPAGAVGVVEKFPCKCDPDSFSFRNSGCTCGAIPKYRPQVFIR